MKKATIIFFVSLTLIFLFILMVLITYYRFVQDKNTYRANETFTIANWNIQTFGDKKGSENDLMNFYAQVINQYDVVFIQEIRDKDDSTFYRLCSMLPSYSCNISSRAGRSPSKEQYGILYLKKFTLQKLVDYNPDIKDRWERPPIRADFSTGNYHFSAYNIHTKPNQTESEIDELEKLIQEEKGYRNIIVLGDMNADCYYLNSSSKLFSSWHWIIRDDDDTTSKGSDCAYDRIMMNDDAFQEFVGYGVYDKIDPSVSDHYIVWARLREYDYDSDIKLAAFLNSVLH